MRYYPALPLLIAFVFPLIYTPLLAQETKHVNYELSQDQIIKILEEIDEIMEDDQKYRSYLSAGTTNDSILQEIDARFDSLPISEAFAYQKSLNLKLPDVIRDSLSSLQHQLDSINLDRFIALVDRYGYPSAERLGVKGDRLFVVLLHPHRGLQPEQYLLDMKELLLPEVKAGRMEAKLYASFYDNILHKVMRLPQLYGTGKSIDGKTMKLLPPLIEDIDKANAARRELGLEELKEGEYRSGK